PSTPFPIPPAARMARFTATFTNWILYSFLLRGFAPCTAASPHFIATALSMRVPLRSLAADGTGHGVGATCPRTIAASEIDAPFCANATAAVTYGQSITCL